MPGVVNAFYLTSTSISNIDEYIKVAKSSNINAFVVDIKDGSMAYESEVAKKYSISNYNSAANSYEKYKNVIDKLKKEGFWIVGTSMNGSDYRQIDYSGKIALVIGNEGKGMSKLVTDSCDFLASIPIASNVESLNASVAAGIMMYEVVRNRKQVL